MDIKIIIAAVVAVFLLLLIVYIKGFKNWLIWAVMEAEKAIGSGAGQVKLRFVYDSAVARFPFIAKLIPFSTFGKMVDKALEVMRKMIENDENVAEAITNTKGGEA